MRWRTTSKFACQSWTTTLFSLLGCGIGLSQTGLGVWLWILTDRFSLLLDEPLRSAFIGYIIIGLTVSLTSLIGVISALLRSTYGLFVYGIFALASIPCQAGVWTFLFLEQRRVFEEFKEKIPLQPEYYDFLAREFNCNLDSGAIVQSDQAVESCANFINGWMQTIVWTMLGLCVVLICLQSVLVIMAAMLYQLIKEELRRNIVQVTPIGQDDSTSGSILQRIHTGNTDHDEHISVDQQSRISEPIAPSAPNLPETQPHSPVHNTKFSSPQDSNKPGTGVQVNTNVTANITINPASIPPAISSNGYDPSPGLPILTDDTSSVFPSAPPPYEYPCTQADEPHTDRVPPSASDYRGERFGYYQDRALTNKEQGSRRNSTSSVEKSKPYGKTIKIEM